LHLRGFCSSMVIIHVGIGVEFVWAGIHWVTRVLVRRGGLDTDSVDVGQI